MYHPTDTAFDTPVWLYGVGHTVKDLSYSESGNPLPPHGLHFSISSKGSFIDTPRPTEYHIPRPLLHQSCRTGWKDGSTMNVSSDVPSHPGANDLTTELYLAGWYGAMGHRIDPSWTS